MFTLKNYKLTIQYDGTDFAGWQIQNNASTVQQTIIDAIHTVTKEKVNLIGSGRTDAGVHALGQAANYKTLKPVDDIRQFQHSLNSITPKSVVIDSMEEAAEGFHSRFDARKRSYIYLFSKSKSPFYYKYSYHFPPIEKYDIGRLNNLSKVLLGEHDYTSLAKKGSDTDNFNCTVYEARWKASGDFVIFFVEANRFLRGMVRAMIGTLLQTADGDYNSVMLEDIINEKRREAAGQSVPGHGLFLYKVRY